MDPFHLVAAVFVALTAVDGVEVFVSIDEISVLRPNNEAQGKPNQLITPGAQCTVGMTNGKYFAVRESCVEVQRLIDRAYHDTVKD